MLLLSASLIMSLFDLTLNPIIIAPDALAKVTSVSVITPMPDKIIFGVTSLCLIFSIELFIAHLESSPNPSSIVNAKLWLGRAYFYSELFLESKKAYLEYQSIGENHPKFSDSLFELSRVLIELNENNDAKILLTKMINDYPNHRLLSKASVLLKNL